MLEYSRKTNQLMQAKYQYELQDVPDPNLYREIFDYESIPKIAFNNRLVPINMPAEIWMTDTTFRDGQQSVSPFKPEQIEHLFKLESRLGGPRGLIRQSEFFLYTDRDREALERCQALGLKYPEITTWIRANEKDFQLVKAAGVRETGILVSCSDYHIFKKMHLTRAQAMDKYLGIVKAALAQGIVPRCHFEDITRADFYGFVLPFAEQLMRLSEESGLPIKVRACDTMGYGVSYPGAALPRSVPGIISPASPPSSWSGTATTTFTRSSPTPAPRGSTAAPASTARCWASASARATARWRPWPSSIRPCAAPPTAWT